MNNKEKKSLLIELVKIIDATGNGRYLATESVDVAWRQVLAIEERFAIIDKEVQSNQLNSDNTDLYPSNVYCSEYGVPANIVECEFGMCENCNGDCYKCSHCEVLGDE